MISNVYNDEHISIDRVPHNGIYVVYRLYKDDIPLYGRPDYVAKYEGYELEEVKTLELGKYEELMAYAEGEEYKNDLAYGEIDNYIDDMIGKIYQER